MKPLVSILIPAFNAQEWISETLRSAVAQTWPNKEIIVVDDGSTDHTLTIAQRFESDGVRVVTQKNQGAAAARNKAFSVSQGDYIQWLDADDLLASDKVSRQMEVIAQDGSRRTLLSSAWGRFLYRSNRAQFAPDALWCDLSPAEFLLRKIGQNLFMPNASWLVSRELTEAAGPWDTNQCVDDDGEYFCRVLLASEGIRFVPQASMYYRVATSSSLSHIGQSDRKLSAQWRTMQLHIRYLRSLEDSQRTQTACLRFLQCNLHYFYPERADIVSQAEQMARDLGGQLETPRLSWKYSWIKPVLGWGPAKRIQTLLRRIKWWLGGLWDRALFHTESQSENQTTRVHGDMCQDAATTEAIFRAGQRGGS
jgi:glycosyltransferase involved in cell wall biosynthesis